MIMKPLPILDRAVSLQKEALRFVGEALALKSQGNCPVGQSLFQCIQVQAFDLARWLSEAAASAALAKQTGREGLDEFEKRLAILFVSESVTRLASDLSHQYQDYGLHSTENLEEFLSLAHHLRIHCTSEAWAQLGLEVIERDRLPWTALDLDETHEGLRDVFAKFSDSVIAPMAEDIHRNDRILPDSVLRQLADLGAFGISIPPEYGGCFYDHAAMLIATEELSRGSLGAGGSVLTRPEICAKALLAGGTEAQKRKWLPVIASGEKMVCVAVTEPNTGSDVARVSLSATRVDDGYVLNGEKTWATFAGRSEILCVLARTGPPEQGHRGLSLFIVEKPYEPGNGSEHEFRYAQPGGGVIEGRSISTIGYRGMHSFSVAFENYVVPAENMIGSEGQGFYLQMQGFAGGRIQTAARALGVMEAAFRAAVSYTKSRKLFGQHLSDFNLTRFKIGRMAARIQANRYLAFDVARKMDRGEGGPEASLVKFLACRDAEWVTREAMQLHGGMGYSEEYAVSRYFLDARVLSIFEGAEEVLGLQVIARPYLEQFLQPVPA
jgi:(2S)-methylsuccinyl-CoA dehydrogenase